jgi:hypothetical protein
VKTNIIDTFPAFLAYWKAAQSKPLDAQIEAWARDYMSEWPELLQKQQDDYADQDIEWRQVARERVFPNLGDRLPAMQVAHKNLLRVCGPIFSAARRVLEFQSDVLFVIYVGIGCGAGWVTRFQGAPAVLFGLENIAECEWSELKPISGLVAHEIGHLVHDHWRAQRGKPSGSGPWWQIYREGLAQRCEHLILGQETWHMKGSGDSEGWLEWCQDHRGWLAAEFLRAVDTGESVRLFFGSWFDICGHRQTGYYLGHELIKQLENDLTREEIALLDSDTTRFRSELERLVQ